MRYSDFFQLRHWYLLYNLYPKTCCKRIISRLKSYQRNEKVFMSEVGFLSCPTRFRCFLLGYFLWIYLHIVQHKTSPFYNSVLGFRASQNGFFRVFFFFFKMAITRWIFRNSKIGQRHSISKVRNYINQYQTQFSKFCPLPPQKKSIYKKCSIGRLVNFSVFH